ncbi:unnamed protein product [Calypogeia fissa]
MAEILDVGASVVGDEEAPSQWAAVENLPTLKGLRTTMLRFEDENGKQTVQQIDVTKLTGEDRHHIIERILRITDEDHERFLKNLRKRLDRVGLELPKIEVRYSHLSIEAEVYQGSRATPSLINFYKSLLEWPWRVLGITKKVKVDILSDVSGILKPSRLTLLLGPPGSGRTTLLRALAGRLSKDLQVAGEITYNGHYLTEFNPMRTSAYVSQYDRQAAELSVRENLDFYCRVQGVGSRYDMLAELTRRERDSKITPEADVDFYMKATAVTGQSTNLMTDYVMKLMGLDICKDTLIGDAMRRGISGGQKKRVTTAEMLVGPAKAFFMDEISTGLDSSTTFEITKMLQQMVHVMDSTVVVSLLQPPPETYDLFDDLILLADGQIVYQGPCSSVMDFMAFMGFRCPDRKATADFLQEVTSRKDQGQYWVDKSVPYSYVSVQNFVEGFKRFHVGQTLAKELAKPFDKEESHPEALVHGKYGLTKSELLKACFAREIILMKRNLVTYNARLIQVAFVSVIAATLFLRTTMHHDTIDDADKYMGALFYCLVFIMTAGLSELSFVSMRLPVYHKEKELCLYPAWAITLPMFILRMPWTILEVGLFLGIVYFTTGFSPEPGRFFRLYLILVLVNQVTVGLFRLAAGATRSQAGSEALGTLLYTTSLLLGGYVIAIDNLPKWWKWASWYSVLQYGEVAITINEFRSKEWDKPFFNTTLGVAVLKYRGLRSGEQWVWISIGALVGLLILYYVLFTLCLHYQDPLPIVRNSSPVKILGSIEKVIDEASRRFVSENEKLPDEAGISMRNDGAKLSRVGSRVHSMGDRAGLSRELSMEDGACRPSIEDEGASLSRGLSMDSDGTTYSMEHDKGRKLSQRFSMEHGALDGAKVGRTLSMAGSARRSMRYDKIIVKSSGLSESERVSESQKGMVLPFRPLSISFHNINYFVDMPDTMKEQGVTGDKLQLLNNVSGVVRPGVLTALVGISGAGKTTLMDVLAGRKTRGYVEGDIFISGYPKQQSTFTRIAGYCEQTDIHSPNVTVYESLVFSAWLRLSPEVDKQTRMMFVEEVMNLVELDVLRDFVVGQPGVSGLSTEQRKRLTIAVELVANPSIIFMDEPTSGLDARAAAIVMRAVRNIGDTGRTIVCTIHQPSIDIFEAFDELLLLKSGGKTIYGGPLGRYSRHLIEYFEAIPGVLKIKDGYNPATWMLEVTSASMETRLGVDFADIYTKSTAYQNNMALVKGSSNPAPGSTDVEFPTTYAQSFWVQFQAGLWKMGMSYWRNTNYTAVKFSFVIFLGLIVGSVFWGLGKKRQTQQDVFNLMGATYCTVLFLGFNFALTVQPVVVSERLVYYRERGAGMYSPWTYAISQFLIEWPFVFLQVALFTVIAYAMIQYEWRYDKFLYFYFIIVFTVLFFCYFGMLCVAVTANQLLAVILATSLFSFLNILSGFVITRKQMPVWWRWLYWCTPTAWSFYGIMGSQLGDVETPLDIPDNFGPQINLKEYLSSYFGFDHYFLKYVAIEQVLLVVTLAILFSLCIKYLNFQQR